MSTGKRVPGLDLRKGAALLRARDVIAIAIVCMFGCTPPASDAEGTDTTEGDGDGDGEPGDGDGDPEPECGNGIVEGTEECDDGNLDETDACTSACQSTCDDGLVDGNETDLDCGGSC